MSQDEPKPVKVNLPIDLWKCEDLKALISKEVRAHVTDVNIAQRLEQALGDAVVYGDGGGGGHVGVA